jgi:hypothetical protein
VAWGPLADKGGGRGSILWVIKLCSTLAADRIRKAVSHAFASASPDMCGSIADAILILDTEESCTCSDILER